MPSHRESRSREPQPAAVIAKGLAAASENPRETNSDRLLALEGVFAALATKTEGHAAAEIAKRIIVALENPQETDSNRLYTLGSILAAFCASLPSADPTRLLALSNLLLEPVPSEKKDEKQEHFKTVCAHCLGKV